jgi:hypothetical protein
MKYVDVIDDHKISSPDQNQSEISNIQKAYFPFLKNFNQPESNLSQHQSKNYLV